jgi:uncharacterized protein YrrD
MRFKEHATVKTSDGEKVGEVDRVVVSPRSSEVTHLIIEKGFLFTEERVLPMALVDRANEDEVILNQPKDSLELPEYNEEYYLPYDELDKVAATQYYPMLYARPVYGYPPPSAPDHTLPAEVDVKVPTDGIHLEEGTNVISADDEHVGDVAQVFVRSSDDQVTHLLISRGLLFTTEKLVPIDWVDSADEDGVHLAVNKTALENLPDYEEK